jgi:hypothetical protein
VIDSEVQIAGLDYLVKEGVGVVNSRSLQRNGNVALVVVEVVVGDIGHTERSYEVNFVTFPEEAQVVEVYDWDEGLRYLGHRHRARCMNEVLQGKIGQSWAG